MNRKEINNQIEKWKGKLFTEKNMEGAFKNMKRYSTSPIIKEIQIQTILRYRIYLSGWQNLKI